jgi:hypothetical protein
MRKKLVVFSAVLLAGMLSLASGSLYAQHNKNGAAPDVTGTWNMTLSSHQIALELKQEGKKVTGTLMMPNGDLPVSGEFVDGKLSLATVTEGSSNTMQLKLNGKLQEDGTLAGEFESPRGRAEWSAERLKKRN